MSANINSTQLPTTYPDGFPLIPLEAVNFSYFLSDTEKDDWRNWLITATEDQKNELVDTLHSIWLDQQKQSLPQAFEANSPLPIIQTQPESQNSNPQFQPSPNYNPSQQFTQPQPQIQPQHADFNFQQQPDFGNQSQFQSQPIQFNQSQQPTQQQGFNFQAQPQASINIPNQPQQFDFQSIPQNNFNTYQQPVQSIAQPQQPIQPNFDYQNQSGQFHQAQQPNLYPENETTFSQQSTTIPQTSQPIIPQQPISAPVPPNNPVITPIEEEEDLDFDDFDFDEDDENTETNSETVQSSNVINSSPDKNISDPILDDEEIGFDDDEQVEGDRTTEPSSTQLLENDLSLNSNLSMSQTNPVLDQLYQDMQDKQKQLYNISGSLNDFQGQFLRQVINSMSLPAELESQLSRLNRDAINTSQRVQTLEDRTQAKPGDSLQDQINQLRLIIEKNRRNLEYVIELQAEEFKEFKSGVTSRLEEVNKQITSALSNTYSESGILERIDKMAARLARIEIDLRHPTPPSQA